MNAQTEKELLANWVLQLEDESVIHQIKALKNASEEGTLLSAEQWDEIEKRREDHKNGKTTSSSWDEVKARLLSKHGL